MTLKLGSRRVSNPEGIITYAYDSLGRKLTTKTFVATANPAVDPAERITSYTYDALSRLKTVADDLNPVSTLDTALTTSYAYDLVGNLDRTDLPNGVISDYVYDSINRLDKKTDYSPDSSPDDLSNNPKLAEYDYTVQSDGKRTGQLETFWLDSNGDSVTEPHVNEVSWAYDDAGRLTDEVFNHFDNALDYTEHFDYDMVGNHPPFTKDLGSNSSIDQAIAYLYDANDRLKTESLDNGNNGIVDLTTTYEYYRTQQTGKTVSDYLGAQQRRVSTTHMICKADCCRRSHRRIPVALSVAANG